MYQDRVSSVASNVFGDSVAGQVRSGQVRSGSLAQFARGGEKRNNPLGKIANEAN